MSLLTFTYQISLNIEVDCIFSPYHTWCQTLVLVQPGADEQPQLEAFNDI